MFSTKKVALYITDAIQKDLRSYMIGALSNIGASVCEIDTHPDHIHILCTLPPTITMANLISKIKTSLFKWIKKKEITHFSWQNGYGTLSVSSSKVELVKKHILN